MSKLKFNKIAFIIAIISTVVVIVLYYYIRPKQQINYNQQIQKYSELLNSDPKNCQYLGQIAASYQALNDFNNAIIFYKRAVDNCPDDLQILFQLGVSYYLNMERDIAVTYMDDAINRAKKTSNGRLIEMFEKDKTAWLEKWELVKAMEWNKGKK